MSAEDAILVEETLARARARRFAALQVDAGETSVDDGSEPYIDLIAVEEAETRHLDADRPVGGT